MKPTRSAPVVCLITPGHVASTPRLVKEADALAEAGYTVHVVAGRHFPPAFALDDSITQSAQWRFTAVRRAGLSRRILNKLRAQPARRRAAAQEPLSLRQATFAHAPEAFPLARAAAATGADLFLGHCIGGITAAALAARQAGGRYAADLEDFHAAETDAVVANAGAARAIATIERALLPAAASLTAASPLIAEKYRTLYDVDATIVLNVFPRTEAPIQPIDPGRVTAAAPARLYWFSQTIGPGRGLENMVRVLGRMRTPAELHLRGFLAGGYRERLEALALNAGLKRPLRFLAPAAPADLVKLAATAHLGLSLEQRTPENRDVCLTNKVFLYLLAGIPQLLSVTSAQRAISPALGAAGLLAELEQVEMTAAAVDELLGNESRLAAARSEAWRLGQSRYCWEKEKLRFLDSVRTAFAPTL